MHIKLWEAQLCKIHISFSSPSPRAGSCFDLRTAFTSRGGERAENCGHTSGLSGLTINACCNDLKVWISLLYDQIVLPSGLNPHEYIGYIFIKLFGIQFYFFPFTYLSRCFFPSFSASVSQSVCLSFAEATCLWEQPEEGGSAVTYIRALTWRLASQ